jgi:hypothetical protein
MIVEIKKMAKAKKKASKKATRGRKQAAKPSPVVIPKGFKPTSNTFAPTWDPANNKDHPTEIIGTWGKERDVEVRRGRGVQKNRVCNITVEDDNGDEKMWSVWHSATLTGLFDEAKEGDTVYIRFDGLGTAKRGQHPPKLYTTGIQE